MRATTPLICLMLALLPAACADRVDPEGTPRRVAREVERALTGVAMNEIARDPELASRLGLAGEEVDFAYGRYLRDRSQAAYERTRLARLETRDLLIAISRPARGSALARHLDTVIAAHENAERLFIKGHGASSLSGSFPYVSDHLRGGWIEIPQLLTRFHPLNTPEDARAFLDRLSQWTDALEDERRRLEADAAAGILPPAPILERMQMAMVPLMSPQSNPALNRFSTLLPTIAGLTPGDRAGMLELATRICEEDVQPAYQRLSLTLDDMMRGASGIPGIWQIPDGEAYYEQSLLTHAQDDAGADGLHETGRREVIARLAELDRVLSEAGLEAGPVADRLRALAAAEGQLHPATPDGHAALASRIEQHAARASALLESQFGTGLAVSVLIRPVAGESSAATRPAQYFPQARNESAPARLDLDLTEMSDWPDYRLAALAFEYIAPGHHLEATVATGTAGLPLVRHLISNTAYSEGWAAYAASLADEAGLYSGNPLDRIGYLQSVLIHAASLVADTGIHAKRWSRDEAVAYLADTTGISDEAARAAIDRMSVQPGHGAAAWIGRQRFLDLRERATRVLGPRFDARAFHEIILTGGPRPLSLVDEDITRWYTGQIQE